MTHEMKSLLSSAGSKPLFSVVFGTGLQIDSENGIMSIGSISFEEAGFKPRNEVEGHGYIISLYRFNDKSFLAFNGRLHLYEGYSQSEVGFPVRLTKKAGIERILLTSASGGISDSLNTGDLVRIIDHINLTGGNPMQECSNVNGRSTFQELCSVYRNSFSEKVECAIEKADLPNKSGTLATMIGPVYETPAEAKFLKIIGADMVSMSIASEAIYAHHLGLKTAGLTVISNHHFKDHGIPNHKNILKNVRNIKNNFNKFLISLLSEF